MFKKIIYKAEGSSIFLRLFCVIIGALYGFLFYLGLSFSSDSVSIAPVVSVLYGAIIGGALSSNA